MSQQSRGMGSPSPGTGDVPAKRKRGRPRKDDIPFQVDNNLAISGSDGIMKSTQTVDTSDSISAGDDEMVGQAVSGVIEGSFGAGYFLKVHAGDTNTHLRGAVFLPGRFTPITEANDVAPNAKMYKRKEIPNPASKPQNQSPPSESSDKQHVETEYYVPKLLDQAQPTKLEFTPEVIVPIAGETQSVADVTPPVNKLIINETVSSVGEIAPRRQVIEPAPENQAAPVTAKSNLHKAVELELAKPNFEASAVVEGLNTDMGIVKELELMPRPSVDALQGSKIVHQVPPAAHLDFTFAFNPFQQLPDEVKGTNLEHQTLDFAQPASISPETIGTKKQITSLENTQQTTELNLCSILSGQWSGMPVIDACNTGMNVFDAAMNTDMNSTAMPMTSLLTSTFSGQATSSEVKVAPEAPTLPSMIDNQICSSTTDPAENKDCIVAVTDGIPPAQS